MRAVFFWPQLPMRIRKNAKQRESNVLLVSGHTSSERYVEWKSAA